MKTVALFVAAAIVALGAIPAAAGSDSLEKASDIGVIAIPAAAAGLTLAEKDFEGAKQLGLSLLSTAAVAEILKLAVREKAPNGDDHAFPSGHAAIAFAGAGFVQMRYGWGYGAPAYVAASFIGYTRVETDRHRVHDVLAGAAIGILANAVFTTRLNTVAVTPVAGPGFIGMGFVRRF